jgi:hypothetical protein
VRSWTAGIPDSPVGRVEISRDISRFGSSGVRPYCLAAPEYPRLNPVSTSPSSNGCADVPRPDPELDFHAFTHTSLLPRAVTRARPKYRLRCGGAYLCCLWHSQGGHWARRRVRDRSAGSISCAYRRVWKLMRRQLWDRRKPIGPDGRLPPRFRGRWVTPLESGANQNFLVGVETDGAKMPFRLREWIVVRGRLSLRGFEGSDGLPRWR